MSMALEWGPILPFVGLVVGGVIAYFTKRTPEKRSVTDQQDSQLRLMMDRVDRLDASNASLRTEQEKQWGVIKDLQKKVNGLMALIETLKQYVLTLERLVAKHSGKPHVRPDDIEDIFKQH